MKKNKKLQDIILQDFKDAIKDTAIDLNYKLAEAYNLSIDAFYADYEPRYYDRTASLYKGSNLTNHGLISGFNKKNIQNPIEHKNSYIAEIQISPKFIPGNPYRADKDWVFERSFVDGIHGQSDTERRQWGNNEWWDNYLRRFPKYENYPDGLRINQYKEYRNLFIHKGSIGGSYFGLDRAGKQVVSGLERKWINGADTKLFNLIQMNPYRHTMSGKKPRDIVFDAYKQLSKRRKIENLFNRNLLKRLASK